MAKPVPTIEWPLRLDRRGEPRTVDQDSVAEITQSVRVLLQTRPGDRPTQPDYGYSDPAFQPATPGELGTGVADIEAARTWEPRADATIVRAAVTDDLVQVTVDVEPQ